MKTKLSMALVAVVAVVLALLAADGSSVRAQPVASIALPDPCDTERTVELYPGCNNIALTFTDGTASETVVQAVTPAGVVESMWRHNAGQRKWQGFSPAYPEVGELVTVNYHDAVWLCVSAVAVPATATPPPPTPTAAPPSPTLVPPSPTAVPPTPIAETQPLPPPQVVGPVQAGGKAEVTISNDSPYTLTIELAGPESRTISIPPCPTCGTHIVPPLFCPEEGPQEVIQVTPGLYNVTAQVDDPSVTPFAGSWDLEPDTGYFSCFLIMEVFGF